MTFADLRFDFSGKLALVVGGSRGIGQGLVQALLEAGATVAYASRRPMEAPLAGASHLPADLMRPETIPALFTALDALGPLDILINAAGVVHAKKIEAIDWAEWREVLRVNLDAAFLLSQQAMARMKPRRSGRIVHIASIAGRHRSYVAGVHYAASKAGLLGLTRQLAYEAAPYGITVNATCPSQTLTDMLRGAMTPEQTAWLESVIPLGRIATVAEQVGPVLFLCSQAAGYMTGTFLDVNGGQI